MPTEQAQAEFDRLFADTRISDRHPEDIRGDDGDSDNRRRGSRSSPEHLHPSSAIRSGNNHRGRSDDSGSDDNNHGRGSRSVIGGGGGKMRSRYFVPTTRSEANTGPKGVIADAQAFEEAKKAAKHQSLFARGRNALTTAAKRASRSPAAAAPTNNPVVPHAYTTEDHERSSISELDESEDDDEGFMEQWRQGRLQELHGQYDGAPTNPAEKRRTSPSNNRRLWGNVTAVDAEGYLDAIEKVGRDVIVVVLIWDDRSDVSSQVETHLRQLAREHSTTRFVKLHYEEAEMEVAGVPALLAYRGGDKFAGMVPVIDEIAEDEELSVKSLEAAMKRHGMLH